MHSEIAVIAERHRTREEEHTRRLAEDPAYAAECAKREQALEQRRAADVAHELERARHHRRVAADIPPRVWPLLDSPARTEALGVVEGFMDGPLTFLVLVGTVGCGKTVAACSALDRRAGRFIKAAAVTRLRFDDAAWRALLTAPALVVDDLGTESLDAKGWAAGALSELFDTRYDWKARTILTSNLDMDGFRARYCQHDGGRFLSRLQETGMFYAVREGSLRKAAP